LPPSKNPLDRDRRIAVVGRRPVLEALTAPEVDVELVRIARGAPAALRSEIQAACRDRSVPCEVGSVARVRELADEPRHDQGVAARVVLHRVEPVEQVLASTAPTDGPNTRRREHWLALDGLTHSGNVGMIARSAAASGIQGIVWPRIGTPWLNALIVKASAGAVLRSRIARCDGLAEGLERFQRAGFRCIGLDAHRGDDLYASAIPDRAVYVVGSETEGLSRPVEALLDSHVQIPLSDSVESLNAAVAAALVCFHVSNPHR